MRISGSFARFRLETRLMIHSKFDMYMCMCIRKGVYNTFWKQKLESGLILLHFTVAAAIFLKPVAVLGKSHPVRHAVVMFTI